MSGDRVVHVVDDDEAVRRSLAFLLMAEDFNVREYESAAELLDGVPDGIPGCIITDARMPDIDGIEFLRRLKARGQSVPVILITGNADLPMAIWAMKEGAVDFIEKPFQDDVILAAVRDAMQGLEQRNLRNARISDARARVSELTDRERQIMDGLVAGKANKVIAGDLGISTRTVEIHRAHVMTKLGIRSLPELVRLALLAAEDPERALLNS